MTRRARTYNPSIPCAGSRRRSRRRQRGLRLHVGTRLVVSCPTITWSVHVESRCCCPSGHDESYARRRGSTGGSPLLSVPRRLSRSLHRNVSFRPWAITLSMTSSTSRGATASTGLRPVQRRPRRRPFRPGINERLVGSGAVDTFFKPGHIIGSTAVQLRPPASGPTSSARLPTSRVCATSAWT